MVQFIENNYMYGVKSANSLNNTIYHWNFLISSVSTIDPCHYQIEYFHKLPLKWETILYNVREYKHKKQGKSKYLINRGLKISSFENYRHING